jgi:hypothetical protein
MNKLLLYTLFALLTTQCGQRKDESSKIPDRIIPVTNSQTVIIPYDSEKYGFFNNSKPTNLSANEIKTLDSILVRCVTDYNLKIDIKKYNRQYIPALTSNNEKIVYINSLCHIPNNDYWKKELMTVKDGGECYFQLKVNLNKRTYYDMNVNGDA